MVVAFSCQRLDIESILDWSIIIIMEDIGHHHVPVIWAFISIPMEVGGQNIVAMVCPYVQYRNRV